MKEVLSQSPHPLFSTLISFYIIILLFFPNHFIQIALSPVLISTAILLISLLRLGSNQKTHNTINSTVTDHQTQINSPQKDQNLEPIESNSSKRLETDQKPLFFSFVGWNVGGPLEVIYEEEDELNDNVDRFGYPLLYLYCSESDSDNSSSLCFEWEGEAEREGLIEIELNGKITRELFDYEEDNLIEIDISSGDG